MAKDRCLMMLEKSRALAACLMFVSPRIRFEKLRSRAIRIWRDACNAMCSYGRSSYQRIYAFWYVILLESLV